MTRIHFPSATAAWTAALCGIMLAVAYAPGARAIDLIGVYQLAVTSDPTYQAAGATNRAAQEVKPQAKALLLPNVNAGADVSRVFLDVRETSSGLGTGNDEFTAEIFALSLTQPVYRQDLFIQLGQAENRVNQADADYAFALQALMLRAAQRYFGVLGAEDQVNFAHTSLESFDQQLKQSQQRFEVGLIAITDVEEAKAGYDLANAAVISAENQLDLAREALREITGEYHYDLTPLGEGFPLVAPDPANIDTWTKTALEQNLSISAFRYSSDVARDEIRRQSAGHLPTLDLVGSMSRDENTGGAVGGSTIEEAAIGLQLNVPIYQGGLVVSQTREAREVYQLSLDLLEERRRAVHRQTRDAYLGVISGISQVRALEQAVRSTQSAKDAIEAGFQVGTRTSVDVLDAERSLFEAKRDLSAARYNYILNTLSLKQAAGTLNEEDLRIINGWLQ